MKKKYSTPVVILLMAVALLLGTQISTLISGDNIYDQLNKFKDVLSLTEKYYVDDVDTQKLTESAIVGLLNNLDPHSTYIAPEPLKKVTEDFRGKFEGIGVSFQIISDTITVLEAIGGGPSATLGIMANDKIVTINGRTSVGYTTDSVMKNLRGPKGTKVSVGIVRPGVKGILDYEIIRDVIPIYSIEASVMLDQEVGYIGVNRFMETTNAEMQTALQKLKKAGMKRLVLDLRGNPGGYLDQAVKMADQFLGADEKNAPRKVVFTRGRRPELNEDHYAYTNSEFEKVPLIVLISNGSASASEIVAGAIQDWDRGLVVGETSFGKGLVQRQFELLDNSAFRLTIARYYTPSGRLIQRSYSSGKDKYQREAFERDEVEGENINHEEEKDSTRPIFHTSKGRKIFGGGGITPDFIVKPDSLTPLSVALIRRNVFLEFITGFLNQNTNELKSRYHSDLNLFAKEFSISAPMMDEFIAFFKGKGIELKDDQFARDKWFIEIRLKAYIARNFWANEGWYKIVLTDDVQLKRALSLFPEAVKLSELR